MIVHAEFDHKTNETLIYTVCGKQGPSNNNNVSCLICIDILKKHYPKSYRRITMTNDFDELRLEWQQATGNLPWGVQRVFRDVFQLAADQKTPTPLVWGRDYGDGGACLVNQGAQFLSLINGEGGEGKPSMAFGEVVGLFDRINREFLKADVNVDQTVSPLAADILLQWFAPLREIPLDVEVNETLSNEAFAQGVFTEPSDEQMARSLMEFFTSAPIAIESTEISAPVGNPFVD